MNIRDIQSAAWKNKQAKGFDTTNIPQEFALTFTELGEAFDAWRRDPDHLPEELADVLIYVTCLAEMTGVDLDRAVQNKLTKNASRVYRRNDQGHMVKEAGRGPVPS